MAGIIPKQGVDFCGSRSYYYIIRSDLGCYMRSSNFKQGSDLSIHALHPSCQHGDHYFADENGHFYIIKGDKYRRVTDLTEDTDSAVFTLHPDCQPLAVFTSSSRSDDLQNGFDERWALYAQRCVCIPERKIAMIQNPIPLCAANDVLKLLWYHCTEVGLVKVPGTINAASGCADSSLHIFPYSSLSAWSVLACGGDVHCNDKEYCKTVPAA